MNNNEQELAWAAGLIEGEGTFQCLRQTGCNALSVQVIVGSTDRDVLQKLEWAMGCGHINGPYMNKGPRPRKDYWRWVVSSKAKAREVMERILPYMGRRRSERIKEILTVMDEWRPLPRARRKPLLDKNTPQSIDAVAT